MLNDLAMTIGGSNDTDAVVRTIVRRSLEAVGAEQGVVTLAPQSDGDAMHTMLRTRIGSGSGVDGAYHFNQSLLGWMQLHMRTLEIADPAGDERFRGVRWDQNVRTLLCAPMTVGSRLVAVLTVYNKRNGERFTDDDKRILTIIASQSAQVVENARLREQERELERIKREVELASVIQGDLLPGSDPAIDGYDVSGRTSQAQVVGGDFFDFWSRPDQRWSITLGDVIGKGLPASLLMSSVQATLRTLGIGDASPEQALRVASSLLYRSTAVDKYVTMVHGILDASRHTFTYVNAGHTMPFLVTCNGEATTLEHRELMLGLTDSFPFTSRTVGIGLGDLLAFYSDGINEAVNAQGEEFGLSRIGTILAAHRTEPAASLVARLIDEVLAFAHGDAQQDDITVVIVRRT